MVAQHWRRVLAALLVLTPGWLWAQGDDVTRSGPRVIVDEITRPFPPLLGRGGQEVHIFGLFPDDLQEIDSVQLKTFNFGFAPAMPIGVKDPDPFSPGFSNTLIVRSPQINMGFMTMDTAEFEVTGLDATQSATIPIAHFPALPLTIQVREFSTNNPISDAVVFVQRTDARFGVRASNLGLDGMGRAIYGTPFMDYVRYDVFAVAPGYFAGIGSGTPGGTSDPDIVLDLFPDSELKFTSILEVAITVAVPGARDLGDANLLVDALEVRRNSVLVEATMVFGPGSHFLVGLEPGSYQIDVPDHDQYNFGSANVTLGSGVQKTVTIEATPLGPSRPVRAETPGQVTGTVFESGTAVVVPLAPVLHDTLDSTLTTFTEATTNGVYVLPDVEPGVGFVQALSPSGNIGGPVVDVDVPVGDILAGVDPEVPVDTADADNNGTPEDSDGDGMSDAYETQHLGGLSAADAQADADPDFDGLSNLDESGAGTGAQNADSDNDGFLDGVELTLGSDPLDIGSTPTPPNPVYVDFGYSGLLEAGTMLFPFSTLDGAVEMAAPGSTIRIKGDVDDVTGPVPDGTVDANVVLESFNGTIRLGDAL